MNNDSPQTVESSPAAEYEKRLQRRDDELRGLNASEGKIIRGRVVSFLLIGLFAWCGWKIHPLFWFLLVAPLSMFCVCVSWHRRWRRQVQEKQRAIKYYRRAAQRLRGEWAGVGPDGADYQEAGHLYASDLDLFGKGSLFQRMCVTVTRQGESELARWLCQPAAPDEIAGRHGAIRELSEQIDLRESLGVLDTGVHDQLDPTALAEWAVRPPDAALLDPTRRLQAFGISLLALLGLGAWIFTNIGAWPFAVVLGGAAAFLSLLKKPLQNQLDEMEKALTNLDQLVNVLQIVEALSPTHPRLQHITSLLDTDGQAPSQQIARLHRVVEQYEGFQRNQMLIPVSLTLLLPVHFARAIEIWRQRIGSHIPEWLDAVGQMEAFCCLAGYAYERPQDVFPEIAEHGPVFIARQIGHPLIHESECVRNDVQMDETHQLIMVSGSNMSGKSTMLRAVGINTVLALAGAPICGQLLRLSPLAVGTSMRIHDSLQTGTSHFYAELRRLRAIVDLSENDLPVLFLLDEVLHGTNSKDRGVGAEAVIRCLLDRRAIGMVTTHDLALTSIVDRLPGTAINVHFADHFEEGKMVFDYKMQAGIVKKSNALELMRSLGLDV